MRCPILLKVELDDGSEGYINALDYLNDKIVVMDCDVKIPDEMEREATVIRKTEIERVIGIVDPRIPEIWTVEDY